MDDVTNFDGSRDLAGGRAETSSGFYRRNLPHIEGGGGPIFVTFCTRDRWVLPEAVRGRVLEHCLYDHGRKFHLCCAVVMPDHVHMIYEPMGDDSGNPFLLKDILAGIKGASAHSVNSFLDRKGSVWQQESFDHVLRSDESLEEKIEYVRQNPVRNGLCGRPEEYSWFWEFRAE